jgi:Tfp pilus assembly protein PilF
MGLPARSVALVEAALVVSLVTTACDDRRERETRRDESAGAITFLNQRPGVRYVGSAACRPCHVETWSTFARTGMGRSWYPLTPDRVVEDWTNDNALAVSGGALRYRMTRRDGAFFMRQFVVGAEGIETAVDERRLSWVVGSGNHSRAYLVSWNDRLFQAPVCWYPKPGEWDLCPGYENQNDYFSREIERTCVFCHNGRMGLRPGTRNAFRDPIPHGIDCERCHGPGELHVAKWARGDAPTGEGDRSIVNPKRLTPALRMQICFQCHLGDSHATERVARTDRSLEDFRPGEPIGSAMVPFRYDDALTHDFGLSAQADRLLLSKCFEGSRGRLECVTCHDPHVAVYRTDRPVRFFDSKCEGCHVSGACRAPMSERAATSPPDHCIGCHMRTAEPDDHRHAVFTDHWIRRRIDDAPRPRRGPALVPYLPAEFASLPAADRAFYTGRAYGLRALALPPAARVPLDSVAEAAFGEAIAKGLDRADVWFFRGKALLALRRPGAADVAFAKAYAMTPHDGDVAFDYAQSLLRARRYEEADRVLEAAAGDHPEMPGPLAELGRSRAARGRYDEALEFFRKASAAEPWNPQLHASEAMMLSALERHDEALREMAEALRYAPGKAALWESYATLLVRAGRANEAARVAAQISVFRDGG